MKPEFKQAIHSHRWHIAGAVAVIAALLLIALVSRGGYPVALVNGSPITAERVTLNYQAAQRYFDNLIKTYPQNAPQEMDVSAVKLAIFNQLVERELIAQGAREEVGSDLAELVRDRISKYAFNLSRAAGSLYGLSEKDFREEILVSQATADILSGRLFLRGEKLEDWLAEAKHNARVVILSGNYAWDGEAVVINE